MLRRKPREAPVFRCVVCPLETTNIYALLAHAQTVGHGWTPKAEVTDDA